MKLVTLTVARSLVEADLICSSLAANEIITFVPDQFAVAAQPLYGGALGGIRIQVAETDLARAREVLQSFYPGRLPPRQACPRCGSDRIVRHPWPARYLWFSILLLGVPLLWMRRRYRCGECGWQWSAGAF
ncbi:MAG: putative signal transducing protein [Kiritimatiellia bacterium]